MAPAKELAWAGIDGPRLKGIHGPWLKGIDGPQPNFSQTFPGLFPGPGYIGRLTWGM